MADEHYGKILHSFWTDPRIKRKLSRDGKLLLAYYFSSPHKNMSGVYYCPIPYASDETGIEAETVRGLLPSLKDFVTFDPDTDEVFVHGMAETAIGEELKAGDTKRKSLERSLAGVHSVRLLHLFQQRYARWGLRVAIPEQRTTPPDTPCDTPSDTRAVEDQENNRTGKKNSLVELRSTPTNLALVRSPQMAAKSLDAVHARLAAFLDAASEEGSRLQRAEDLRKVWAELVFAYWAHKTGHAKSLMDHGRERRLVKRLEESQDNVSELLYVVDGALKDDWTMGRDPRSSKKYDGIETLFQDRAHVEKFAGLCQGYRDGKPHPMATKYLGPQEGVA